VSKGGKLEDTVGRKCLCNALVANIGQPQVRSGKHVEQALITSGDDLKFIAQFLPADQSSYSAADVIGKLLGSPQICADGRRSEKDSAANFANEHESLFSVAPLQTAPVTGPPREFTRS
jgi:hypothetical protein